MRLTTTGIAANIDSPVVGRITSGPRTDRAECIRLTSDSDSDLDGYRGLITSIERPANLRDLPTVYAVRSINHLQDGDIVVMSSRGLIRTIFIRSSHHNALFVTEKCNSHCLMCSQPPKIHEDTKALLQINRALIPLIPVDTQTLGITGGEPTLLNEDLFDLIVLLRDHLPNTGLHLLTNARRFAASGYTKRLAKVLHPNLILGVPLYSDAATHHDYIVQDRGAFDETVTALHELAKWGISVELRIVLHRLTIPRLLNWAEYVYRNLPFVVHVAFMALEPTGYAAYNHEKLWIDPSEYRHDLANAVSFLSIRGMNVSLYNLQHCVLDPSLWRHARRSISDWKNKYIDQCADCTQRAGCAGFFETAGTRHTADIHALSA